MRLHPATTLPVAAAIIALALAGGGFGPVPLGVGTAAVWLLLAGLGLGGRLTGAGLRSELVAALVLLGLVAAWTALSLSWASDDGAAFVDLSRALFYLGIVALVGLTARPGSAPSWIAAVALAGVSVAALAVLSRTLGFGGDTALAAELPRAAERLSYPLGYWNALGYLMAMTLPALAWLAVTARPGAARLAAAGSVPVVLALFLTSSRGAVLAGLAGLLVVAYFAADRPRLLRAGVAVAPAWVLVVVVAAARRGELDAASGVSLWGLIVAAAVALGAALAYYLAGRLLDSEGGTAPALPRPTPARIAVLVAVLAGLVALVGPSSFVGEFRTRDTVDPAQASNALVSGSGRSSFWRVAVEAFAEDPLRGTGGGGYPYFWNVNGDLPVPVANAHSTQLETFAELGLVGGIALLGLLVAPLLAAWRLLRPSARLSSRPRATAGAALGILAAGLIAITIDWTWQLPAATTPLLIAIALLCGAALRPPGSGGAVLVDSRIAGYEPVDYPRSPPRIAVAGVAVLAGVAAVWVGLVLAIASVQLDRSGERLAEGDLQGAAEAARAAARIEPWSPEPSLRLAEIEQAATNYQAARRRAEDTVRLSPDDFRPWLLLFETEGALGNQGASLSYLLRAVELGPRILAANDLRQGFR